MTHKYILMGVMAFSFFAYPVVAGAKDMDADKKSKRAEMFHKMFDYQDANNDGAISEEEFLQKAKARFAKMDANDDGQITKEEAKTQLKKMHEKHKMKKNKYHEGEQGGAE